jgi:hypothetical protein
MKLFRFIGTAIVLAVLCAAIVLTLTAGTLRFIALNPAYFKTFLPTKSYCTEMRENLSDDLDHVALLYGLKEGSFSAVVTDESIVWYTNTLIDALYAEDAKAPLDLPAYPADGFKSYLRANTAFAPEGIDDCAQDAARAVTEDLSAINTKLVIEPFLKLRNHTFSRASLVLFGAGALLAVVMLIFLTMLYYGKAKRTGAVLRTGGCFMGVTLVFVPVMQFLLFGYVERLNITASAFRTILTGYLHTLLYGWFVILLVMELLTFLLLLIAISRAAHGKKKKAR